VNNKLMTLRSFKRDRNYAVGQSLDAVQAAFPSATINAVGRKGRYVGIFGDKRYQKAMRTRLTPLPYVKRSA